MRILHIDPDDIDSPMAGGGPQRTHAIYSRLAARHEITVLTPTFKGSTPEIVRNGVRYVRLGRKVGNHNSSHHITFFFQLPLAIRRFDCDVLIEDLMPPASATLNPLFSGKPHIASVQWFYAEALSKAYRLPFFLGERYGIRLYRHFIVLSRDMEQRIRRWHPRADCVRIPEGIPDDLLALPIRAGNGILFLGQLNLQQKGLDLLLRAYASIPVAERVPLQIAGHTYQQAAVDALVTELGLGSWVTILGRVDESERGRLLQACRFVCVPSREETFGMVIAEACAAGKPVVLFDRAPMNEVCSPDACELVPPFEVAAYAEAMRRLLNATSGEIERRGEIARRWARRFSWDDIAGAQEAFYRRVLDERDR